MLVSPFYPIDSLFVRQSEFFGEILFYPKFDVFKEKV